MTRLDNLMQKLTNKTDEMKRLRDEGKTEEAFALVKEVNDLKAEIEKEKEIENLISDPIEIENKDKGEGKIMENKQANFLRAMVKNVAGKQLTAEEKAVLTNAITGESYILPQDLSTKIRTLVRDSKCFKNYLGHISTTALTGAFPVEGFETVTGLADFTDGNEIAEANDISFKQVTFSLKEKAALIKLTNTLLMMTDNDLINYVAGIFAKKAVVTYNTMAITTLKKSKSPKALANVKALIKSLRVDLDPTVLDQDAVIVTNQDAYNAFCESVDGNTVAFLQPDLSKPASLYIDGVPVVVFSNGQLPTSTNKCPVFYGNLKMGASFVDAGKYSFAVNDSVGFKQNVTYARVIDYVDCIQTDVSDKVYLHGEVTIA